MRLFKSLAIAIFLVLLNLSPVYSQEEAPGKEVSAKAVAVSEVQMGWTTQAVLSSYVGDSNAVGYMDLLIPLLQNDNGMLFLYPRLGLSSDVNPGYSMGLGVRHYIPAIDAIIGGNVFYDRYDSPSGNYYNQLGLGLEVLTRWVDARFNYYIPDSSPNVIDSQNVRSRSVATSSAWGQPYATGYSIRQPYTTTTRTTTVNQLFERFEDTMQGFDAEIGVLTPWLERYVALRWFAGYYNFNNSYGSDIGGLKGRAEIRFSQKLAIDATYYADEEITGSNWLFGIRMTIPIFMENLADGRSPFQGSFSGMLDGVNMGNRNRESGILRGGAASTYPSSTALSPFAAMAPAPSFASASRKGSTVRDRMTEQTLRLSSGARTSQSGFIEDPNKRRVNTETKTKTRIVVINDSIVFVDNARGTLGGPGTFENPLSGIQGGVNRASVLFGNRGDVFVAGTGTTYTEDVVDAGSSVKIWGGARGIPVNGGRRFTNGSRPVLDGGFQIANVPEFALSGFQIINGFSGGDGVNTDGVDLVSIVYNDISVGDDAIELNFDSTGVHNFFIANNNLHDNGGNGIYVDDVGDGELVGTAIGNNISNSGGMWSGGGFVVDVEDEDGEFTFNIFGNTFAGNDNGILINGEDTDEANQTVTTNVIGNIFTDNDTAIFIDYNDNDTDGNFDVVVNTNVIGNTFMGQNSNDFRLEFGQEDDADSDGASYTFNNTLRGNIFSGASDASVLYETDTYDASDIELIVMFDIAGNQFMNVGGDAIRIDQTDNDDYGPNISMDIEINGNLFSNIADNAIEIEIADTDASDDVDVRIGVNNNTILNTGSTAIWISISDTDDTSAFISGNFIDGAGGDGLFFQGEGTTISSPMGNNLISDVTGSIFDISDVDGQFLINGALVP